MNNENNDKQKKKKEEQTGEERFMYATIERSSYKKLNLNKLNFSSEEMSMKEALSDVIPIQWSEDVLQGKRNVIIRKANDE